MTSTRNLRNFPNIAQLHEIMQSLAMLDAIIEAEWDSRYFSFNAQWSSVEKMGSLRNGLGDDLFAVFSAEGCFLRGFDHESVMSPWAKGSSGIWPGVLESVPIEFAAQVVEPAFHMSDTTFCIWRRTTDTAWSCGEIAFPEAADPDGSGWMLPLISQGTGQYATLAREYYETEIPESVIARVLAHEPLSPELVAAFPTSRKFLEVCSDAVEIGYPIKA